MSGRSSGGPERDSVPNWQESGRIAWFLPLPEPGRPLCLKYFKAGGKSATLTTSHETNLSTLSVDGGDRIERRHCTQSPRKRSAPGRLNGLANGEPCNRPDGANSQVVLDDQLSFDREGLRYDHTSCYGDA